jgi:hypothetical protein
VEITPCDYHFVDNIFLIAAYSEYLLKDIQLIIIVLGCLDQPSGVIRY